jgi:hypothetical protein
MAHVAAPYVHSRLAKIEHTGKGALPLVMKHGFKSPVQPERGMGRLFKRAA